MAVVWRAIHHGPGKFRRMTAVKQMYPHLASQRYYRDLFEEEARVGSILQDPNIAQVYDFVDDGGELYLAMEWVSGVDLATYIHYVTQKLKSQTRWEVVAAIGIGVLRALAAAHERTGADGEAEPILHRDVSPHNVLISDAGGAKLIDFGLSFTRDRDIDDTHPGMAKGKRHYLSPEILRGGRPTPHSDQFAVGCLLWEALVGRRAFAAETEIETYQRVANAELDHLLQVRPNVPKRLAALVHHALARDPAKRYASCREMARHLGGILHEHKLKEDLYSLISKTARAARAEIGLGQKTQAPSVETPVPAERSGMVELLVGDDDRPTGFRKWIPAFIRNLTD